MDKYTVEPVRDSNSVSNNRETVKECLITSENRIFYGGSSGALSELDMRAARTSSGLLPSWLGSGRSKSSTMKRIEQEPSSMFTKLASGVLNPVFRRGQRPDS